MALVALHDIGQPSKPGMDLQRDETTLIPVGAPGHSDNIGIRNTDDAVYGVSIVVGHRPEVQARRTSEARAAELAEQKRKDAAWVAEQKAAGRLGTPRVVNPGNMYPGRPRGQA